MGLSNLVILTLVSTLHFACTKKKSDCDPATENCGEASSSSSSSSAFQNLVPTNLVHDSVSFLTDRSPEIQWDSVTDATGYDVSIGTSIGATDVLEWSEVGNVNVFQAINLNLSSAATYYISVRATHSSGAKSAVVNSEGWRVESCPAGFIAVPGNNTSSLGGAVYTQGTKSNYNWVAAQESIRNTSDFCVMKYEAKIVGKSDGQTGDASTDSVESRASGTPWVSLPRELAGDANDAQEVCESLGEGYQLTGNHHWQAIARDIESVPSNYTTSGIVSNYSFNRGHSDNSPAMALAADSSDSNGCFGVTSNGDPDDDCGGGWHINKRTHILSNGQVIWDFAGNVWEWIRDPNSSSQGGNDYIQQGDFANSLAWGPSGDYSEQLGVNRAGLGFGNLDFDGGAFFRGGRWSNNEYAGLYFANLFYAPSHTHVGLGFRCVYAP